MCTVSFTPVGGKVLLASNRDEKSYRSPAMPPLRYKAGSGDALYPKDGDAGGTWIALHENGNALVFLNGGWESHMPKPPYRKSRGLVLLDLIHAFSPLHCFQEIKLGGIEPFTAVIWQNGELWEGAWDGERKRLLAKDPAMPHLWSSVTLYDSGVRARREKWFEQWLESNPYPSMDEVLHFHEFTGDGDSYNDLLMNRNGKVYTVSITGMEIGRNKGRMWYKDLQLNKTFGDELQFTRQPARH